MRARHNDYGATTIVLVFVFFINVMLQIESLAGIMADSVEKIGEKTDDGSQEFIGNDVKPLMNFGTNNSTVIIAQTGSTALIPCVVQNMGDSMVSWIRRKGVQQLLTVGLTTYASDERFQAIHFQHSADWTLQIKYVQQRDAGIYECQVSTHPPSSIFLLLQVVDAHTEIDGPLEKYFRPDSNLLLHCVVKKSTETPSYLFWYHNARMVNYDTDRGYNISTDLSGKESWLEISRATIRHSGNYTCEASNAKSTRVLIHVFNGDNPAAMQHSSALSSFSKNYFLHKNNIIIVISIVIIRSILNAIHIRNRSNLIVR